MDEPGKRRAPGDHAGADSGALLVGAGSGRPAASDGWFGVRCSCSFPARGSGSWPSTYSAWPPHAQCCWQTRCCTRRRPLASRIGVAFLGSILPLVALLVEAAGRSPFPTLELLPFGFGLAALAWANGLFGLRPEEIGSIDRAAGRGAHGRRLDRAGRQQYDPGHEFGGGTVQRLYAPAALRAAYQLRLGRSRKAWPEFQLQPGSGDEAEHAAGGGLEIPEHPGLATDGPQPQSLRMADTVAGHDRAQAHRRFPAARAG